MNGSTMATSGTISDARGVARPTARQAAVVGFVALLLASCTGKIGEIGSGSGGAGNTPGGGGRPGMVTGSGGATQPPPPPPPPPTTGGGMVTPEAAGPLALRRLTVREYNNTVADLFGDTTRPALSFPTDSPSESGFVGTDRSLVAARATLRGGVGAAGERRARREQADDPVHQPGRLRRSDVCAAVHPADRTKGLPPARVVAGGGWPDGAVHARARARPRFPAVADAGGPRDAAGAGVHLSLGARPEPAGRDRRRRAADLVPGGVSAVVFPVGDDAGHRARGRGRRRRSADRRRGRDAGASHAGEPARQELPRELPPAVAADREPRQPAEERDAVSVLRCRASRIAGARVDGVRLFRLRCGRRRHPEDAADGSLRLRQQLAGARLRRHRHRQRR